MMDGLCFLLAFLGKPRYYLRTCTDESTLKFCQSNDGAKSRHKSKPEPLQSPCVIKFQISPFSIQFFQVIKFLVEINKVFVWLSVIHWSPPFLCLYQTSSFSISSPPPPVTAVPPWRRPSLLNKSAVKLPLLVQIFELANIKPNRADQSRRYYRSSEALPTSLLIRTETYPPLPPPSLADKLIKWVAGFHRGLLNLNINHRQLARVASPRMH